MKKRYLLFLVTTQVIASYCSLGPVLHAPQPYAAAPARNQVRAPRGIPAPPACTICTETYDGNEHLRIRLDCSVPTNAHQLCLTCIMTLANSARPCPWCRAPLKCSNTIKIDTENNLIVEGMQEPFLAEAQLRQLVERLSFLERTKRLYPHLFYQELNTPGVAPIEEQQSLSQNHIDTMEIGVAVLLGLLLSTEFNKSPQAQETASRGLYRTLYVPAFLCGNAVLNKFIPHRRWTSHTVACWTIGLVCGMIIPDNRHTDSPAQSRSENVEGTRA